VPGKADADGLARRALIGLVKRRRKGPFSESEPPMKRRQSPSPT
jgi:hypothetical protein